MADPSQPYAAPRLTRRQRRASERRSAARAAIRARSMPPPRSEERVDPVTGQPLHLPSPGTSLPGLAGSSSARSLPSARPTPAPTTPATTAPTPSAPHAGAAVPRVSAQSSGHTDRPRRGPRPRRARRARGEQTLADLLAQQHRPGLGERLSRPADRGRAPVWLAVGSAGAAAGFGTALTTGVPVLGHGWSLAPLGEGIAAMLVSSLLLVRGWRSAGLRSRIVVAALLALVLTCLTVGVLTRPVVLDGRVLANSSKDARSVRMGQDAYTDIRRMGVLDDLLAADLATARAQVSQYAPAVTELTTMSAKWSAVATGDVPDPAFADLAATLKTAAYWESAAMSSKQDLIEQQDSGAESDLESQRATFTQSWLEASSQLTGIGTALGIPISHDQEGPHE